ncbi:MAG: hypothetical protein ACREFW_11335 [Rhizomicrobium sp.]
MSAVRILAFLALGLLLAALASGRIPNSYAFALLTGQCLRDPPPLVCGRNPAPAGGENI